MRIGPTRRAWKLFGRIVDQIPSLPVLLIVTFRPEFDAPWIGRPYVTALTLNRLGERDIGAMIDARRRQQGPAGEYPAGHHRAHRRYPAVRGGNDEGGAGGGERGRSAADRRRHSVSALAVPASLHASLMARLDRLGPAKEMAQIGAAIGREFSHTLLAAVARKPEPELASALDRIIAAGLLFRQGVPPQASYLFKHALVQDAAYGTLLREPRRSLHARIAETLESQFVEIAENRPELLARHCTEAGLIEKAVAFWGKAGQRSLERSALVEAVEQLTRALAQIATLPASPVQRREEIRCQVALANALMHTKGYAAPETRAALDQARALIENANALGEPPEDPLLLFSNLYGFWVSNYVAFDGDVIRALARKFLVLAEERGASVPLMIAHRIMGCSLASTGDLVEARVHFDCAVALYDPAAHRPLAARFGQDNRVTSLAYGSVVVWLLGYPDAAYAYAESAVKNARELGQAAALMYSLFHTSLTTIFSGRYEAANARLDELVGLAEEKNAAFWRAGGTTHRGCALAMTGKAADALHMINTGMTALRSTGATMFSPLYLSYLARACVELGKFDDASHWISEARVAMQTSKESWWEAEIDRIEGELALKSPLDVARAEVYFERALAVARQQQAKSWELRAAMSLRAALARPGQGAASARTACSGLRLVHRRVRHARSEGGEGVARRVGCLIALTLRHPGLAHAFNDALSLGQIDWVVIYCKGACYREAWVKRKTGFDDSPCLLGSAKICKGRA